MEVHVEAGRICVNPLRDVGRRRFIVEDQVPGATTIQHGRRGRRQIRIDTHGAIHTSRGFVNVAENYVGSSGQT